MLLISTQNPYESFYQTEKRYESIMKLISGKDDPKDFDDILKEEQEKLRGENDG